MPLSQKTRHRGKEKRGYCSFDFFFRLKRKVWIWNLKFQITHSGSAIITVKGISQLTKIIMNFPHNCLAKDELQAHTFGQAHTNKANQFVCVKSTNLLGFFYFLPQPFYNSHSNVEMNRNWPNCHHNHILNTHKIYSKSKVILSDYFSALDLTNCILAPIWTTFRIISFSAVKTCCTLFSSTSVQQGPEN